MNTSLESKLPSLEALKVRAQMLAAIRSFFAARRVLEVDTPILSRTAPIATHIEVMSIHFANGEKGYLHTSTEYAMKRLLAEHPIDTYQLCHVFREGEISKIHNPEFTMIEWYRVGFSLDQLIQETVELIQLFIGSHILTSISYQDLFQHHLGIDPFQTTPLQLHLKAQELKLDIPSSAPSWDVDTWLHFYMCFYLEPRLQGLTVLHSFPASQAALSRLRQDGPHPVAERFEILYNDVELANGFHELTDSVEQRRRFENDNAERKAAGKPPLPLDEHFLAALQKGLPDCCGVAVGFDRLLLLKQKASALHEVFPFTWEQV